MEISPHDIDAVLDRVYAWSRARDYKGHNKHDGLNSPVLRACLGWGKWPRILAIQGVMRSPLNPRPLLGVSRTSNPKGLALFTKGLLDRYRVHGAPEFLAEAADLLDRILALRAPGTWSGFSWGYPYPWQDLGFYATAHFPNAVVTCFVCEAFLEAHRITGRRDRLETVGATIPFLVKDLPRLKDTEGELCLGYVPVPMRMRVMDVSILVASVLAQHAQLSGDPRHLPDARRLIDYVVGRQTDYGAWYYTDPPDDSPIRHDNYHTGFILDALARCMHALDDGRWMEAYQRGLDFYAECLFNADGSPRWMSDRDLPHDIHGAAQGILTFSRHRDRHGELADRIVHWSLAHMYDPSGRFYYQETCWGRKRFTLLRWCNAWMARALAYYHLSCAATRSAGPASNHTLETSGDRPAVASQYGW